MQFLHFAFGAGLGASPLVYGLIIDVVDSVLAFYWILAILVALPIPFPLKMTSPLIETEYLYTPR